MDKTRFYIQELDGLRFIAFILIFIHHINATNIFLIDKIKSIGWIGVDIFFCLSAFLLTRLLHIEANETGSISIKNFYVRRILRIWPLYFTYIVIGILFSLNKGVLTNENWFRSIGLLTFTDNIFTSVYHYNPILFTGHLWTISYEEQFYFVLPFFMLLLVRRNTKQRNTILLAVFIMSCLIRLIFIYINAKHPAIWVLPITHFDSIWVGILMAFNSNTNNKMKPALFYIGIFISLIVILLLPGTGVNSYHLMVLYPCVGILSGCMLSIALYSNSKLLKGILSADVVVYLGKISFGLYVFHSFSLILIDYFLRSIEMNTTWLNISLSLLLSIFLASLSYLFLEKRFLDMKGNFTKIPSKPIV